MSKCKKSIWGRQFNLDIDFDCYEDEEVLPIQESAYEQILDAWDEVDGAWSAIRDYCKKQYGNLVINDEMLNPLKYVIPRALFFPRDKQRIAALLCDFKFDGEHGLAVVFKNGKLFKIGPQDIVL